MTRAIRCLPAALLAILTAACSPAPSSPASSASPGSGPTATPTFPAPTPVPTVAAPSPSDGIALPGEFESPFGTVFDALPPDFPLYPGSRLTETGDEPATARLDTPGDRGSIVLYYRASLEKAGLGTLVESGPAEDGAVVLTVDGAIPGCFVRVTVGPLGGTTLVSIWYGAACPLRGSF
jgi:hypothetical protein